MAVARCWGEMHGVGSHEVDRCGFPDRGSETSGWCRLNCDRQVTSLDALMTIRAAVGRIEIG
jgi:hypothetical protein